MKCIASIVLIVVTIAAIGLAEPPIYRRNSRLSRQFARQQVPHEVYGPPPEPTTTPAAPKPVYGPPPQPSYGPPPETTTDISVETTTEPLSEPIDANSTANATAEQLQQGVIDRGIYYIYHPNGLLQKVVYNTKDDIRNMAYTAQVKYENVEPIREPIFTYDPRTLALTKLQG